MANVHNKLRIMNVCKRGVHLKTQISEVCALKNTVRFSRLWLIALIQHLLLLETVPESGGSFEQI